MKISNKLLLVLSSVTLLAGCTPAGEGGKPECPQCPECTQCETCKECEECKECPQCETCKECEECKECPECPTPHEHTFKDTWSMDENKHWKEATCDHHDITKDLGEHIDVDTNGECDVCGYTFVVVPNRYTVIWENYDGKLLEVDYDVLEGSTPEYNGEDPVRTDDEDIYIFSGWSPEVTKVTGNTRYAAQFEVNTKTYKVTWEDDAGNILKQEDVQIGHVPSFGDKDPVKESTEMVEFLFTGWDKEITRVFEDTTYKASFKAADWCVTEEQFLNALKKPENPNFKLEVKSYINGSLLETGTYEMYNGLLIEHSNENGTVYMTKDRLTIYYEDGMDQWIALSDSEFYDSKFDYMFLYDGYKLEDGIITCHFENHQYILQEDQGGDVFSKTYLTFNNTQIVSMRAEMIQKNPSIIMPYFDFTFSWGGCEDIEIPEEVLGDAKYKIVGSVYDAARTLLDSQTLTQHDYQVNVTTVVKVAKLVDNRYLLQVDCEGKSVYYDNFFQYIEDNTKEIYVKFDNSISPETIYKDSILSEVLPDVDYVFNEELHSYVYVDIDHNTTYIVQFEFGLPVSVKLYDNINEELLSKFVFSDYNSTTVIIPEHDWNY